MGKGWICADFSGFGPGRLKPALVNIFSDFFGLLGSGRVNSGPQWVKRDLLCSYRQPPAEIRDFSGHPKSATPNSVISALN